jgi:hypothetical protein
MHRSLMLCAAGGLIAAGFLAASPTHAAPYRVIKWPITRICQIWDYGLPDRPFPPGYRVITPPLPSFGAALHVKDRLWHRGVCGL